MTLNTCLIYVIIMICWWHPLPSFLSININILIILTLSLVHISLSPFPNRQWPDYCKSAKIGTFLWLIITCLWATCKLGIEYKFGYALLPFSTTYVQHVLCCVSIILFILCIEIQKVLSILTRWVSGNQVDQWAWIPGYLKLNRRDNLRLFLELQIGFLGIG